MKFFFLEIMFYINKNILYNFSKYNDLWFKNYIKFNIFIKLKNYVIYQSLITKIVMLDALYNNIWNYLCKKKRKVFEKSERIKLKENLKKNIKKMKQEEEILRRARDLIW